MNKRCERSSDVGAVGIVGAIGIVGVSAIPLDPGGVGIVGAVGIVGVPLWFQVNVFESGVLDLDVP